MTNPRVDDLIGLIQAEYREMPCLRLTKPQMQRLWGLEQFVCDALVDALVAAQVLHPTSNGAYIAATAARDDRGRGAESGQRVGDAA